MEITRKEEIFNETILYYLFKLINYYDEITVHRVSDVEIAMQTIRQSWQMKSNNLQSLLALHLA